MTEQIAVDDFLEHFGVRGMKWGRHTASPEASTSSSSKGGGAGGSAEKPKMSRNKKIAIGVGIGAVVAIGAAVALSSMNKNMDLPISDLIKRPSTPKGKNAVTTLTLPSTPKKSVPQHSPKGTGLDLGPTGGKRPSLLDDINSVNKSSNAAKDELAGYRERDRNAVNKMVKSATTELKTDPYRVTARSTTTSGPSLDVLSNLINGGPQVNFNPKTGRYETH